MAGKKEVIKEDLEEFFEGIRKDMQKIKRDTKLIKIISIVLLIVLLCFVYFRVF